MIMLKQYALSARSATTDQQRREQKMLGCLLMSTMHTSDESRFPQAMQFSEANSRPIAFVVEPREEVSARLTGDLIEAGYRVVCAPSPSDALKACGKYRPRLVIAQLALPSQTAWQLAPKLAMLDSDTRVVLYSHKIAVQDYAVADFLGIEQLIEYGGDLFRLSMQIRQLIGNNSPERTESVHHSQVRGHRQSRLM